MCTRTRIMIEYIIFENCNEIWTFNGCGTSFRDLFESYYSLGQ
jgi:hypothetical protein